MENYLLILLFSIGITIGSEMLKIAKTKNRAEINDDFTTAGDNLKIKQIQESTFITPDEKWTEMALKDIAYYLRNHKFNEWDRRIYTNKTPEHSIGFYKAFPEPKIKYLDQNVNEHCKSNFYNCITYLYSIIENTPLTRADDIVTKLNNRNNISNDEIARLNADCNKTLQNIDDSGLPFNNPLERFYWRTSASYFMCWYTMLATPALSMLGEPCDNFASCLSSELGAQNRDPRANDKNTFSCALYSFCPDPCCNLKHLKYLSQCNFSKQNPCYLENIEKNTDKTCKMKKDLNLNFQGIMNNLWNVSCNCQQPGFVWKSQFGLCVDLNECAANMHKCDPLSEQCFNLPGSHDCICKVGFAYDAYSKKCEIDPIRLIPRQKNNHESSEGIIELFLSLVTKVLQLIA